jgi:hypothetical protein
MPYLGKSPSQGVRTRFQFTPNAGTTAINGVDANNLTLSFTDGNYVDVYLNGVMLKAGVDYNTTTANQVTLSSGTVASDVVDIVVYDTFSLFGGTLEGNVKVNNGTFNVTGAVDFDSTLNVDGVVTTDGATHDGDVTFTGANYNAVWDKSDNALEFGDNAKAVFGAGSDLIIQHDGSRSIIQDNGTGNLRIQANNLELKNADNSHDYVFCSNGGAVELYHNNSKKIETTSSGVTVSGYAYITENSGTTQLYLRSNYNSTGPAIQGATNHPLMFLTNNSEKMRIDTNKGVGINGTPISYANGQATLFIEDTTNPAIGISDTGQSKDYYIVANGSRLGVVYGDGSNSSSASNVTEIASFDNSGNVGIGTDAPSDYNAAAHNLVIYESGGSGITLASGTSGSGRIYFADGTSGDAEYRGYIIYDHDSDDLMRFGTAATERMRITSSGNVGIGSTNSEEYPLFVKGSNISSGGGSAALCILDSGTAYNGTNPGGGVTFRGKYNNGGSTTNFATVQGIKENNTDGDYATALRFTTRANGGNLIERLRIASGGKVYTCDTSGGDPHRFLVSNRVSIAPNGSKTHTITGMYQGYATLKIGYTDGNAQYAHFVAELGGHMWSSSNGYNATVVANSASTMSISVTKNNASYVVTVNAGSNYAYGSIELSGGSFTVNSGATYAFS